MGGSALVDSVRPHKYYCQRSTDSHSVKYSSLIFDLVDEHLLLCRAAVNSYLDSERMPYTQNNHYYQTSKDKWLAIYKEQRAESTSNAAKSTLPSTTPKLSFTPRSPPKTTNPPLPAWSAFGGFSSSQEAPTSGTPSPTAPFAATPVPQAPRPFSFSVNGVSATASSGALKTTPVPLLGQPLSSADTDREQKIRDALSLLTSAGWDGLKPEDLGKLHPPDIYEREMNVMAEVRGYFKVSFKVRPDFCFMSTGMLTTTPEGHGRRTHDD